MDAHLSFFFEDSTKTRLQRLLKGLEPSSWGPSSCHSIFNPRLFHGSDFLVLLKKNRPFGLRSELLPSPNKWCKTTNCHRVLLVCMVMDSLRHRPIRRAVLESQLKKAFSRCLKVSSQFQPAMTGSKTSVQNHDWGCTVLCFSTSKIAPKIASKWWSFDLKFSTSSALYVDYLHLKFQLNRRYF